MKELYSRLDKFAGDYGSDKSNEGIWTLKLGKLISEYMEKAKERADNGLDGDPAELNALLGEFSLTHPDTGYRTLPMIGDVFSLGFSKGVAIVKG